MTFVGSAARSASARDPVRELHDEWRRHTREVRRRHEKLFYRPLLAAVARLPGSQARLTPEAARERLVALGYVDPVGALRHLEALTTGVSRAAAIQRTLLPVLLGWFADGADPDAGLLAFRRVSDALGTHPLVPASAPRRGRRGRAARPSAVVEPVRERPAPAPARRRRDARRRRRAPAAGAAALEARGAGGGQPRRRPGGRRRRDPGDPAPRAVPGRRRGRARPRRPACRRARAHDDHRRHDHRRARHRDPGRRRDGRASGRGSR